MTLVKVTWLLNMMKNISATSLTNKNNHPELSIYRVRCAVVLTF